MSPQPNERVRQPDSFEVEFWDAQWDMLWAVVGAVMAVGLLSWPHDRSLRRLLRSFE